MFPELNRDLADPRWMFVKAGLVLMIWIGAVWIFLLEDAFG